MFPIRQLIVVYSFLDCRPSLSGPNCHRTPLNAGWEVINMRQGQGGRYEATIVATVALAVLAVVEAEADFNRQ